MRLKLIAADRAIKRGSAASAIRLGAAVLFCSLVAARSGAATPQIQPSTAAVVAGAGSRAEPDRPRRPSEDALAAGAELYGRMCAVCHGSAGEGDKADHATALAHPDFLASVTDEFLRRAVEDGRAGTTMSAWSAKRGGPLSPAEADALIAFMLSWKKQPRAELDERPVAGSLSRGATIYASECARCHGAKGTGGPDVNIGNPEFLRDTTNGFLRYAMSRGRKGTAMPGFKDKLGDSGIEDLLALLRNWQSTAAASGVSPSSATAAGAAPSVSSASVQFVPLNPDGPEPAGFQAYPGMTPVNVVKSQLDLRAKMMFLDARSPSDYSANHISGAVSVPFYAPEPLMPSLPRDVWLVCYCACPHAESGQLAQKLEAHGFPKVTVLDEGFGIWKLRGYPVHPGPTP